MDDRGESPLQRFIRDAQPPLWLVKLPWVSHRYRVLVVQDDKPMDITPDLVSRTQLRYDGGNEAINLSVAGDPLGALAWEFEKLFGYEPRMRVI